MSTYCHHQFPATNYCCRYRHQFFASYRYRRQLETTAASCYRLPPPVFASYRRQSPLTTAASRYQLLPATAASFCKKFNSMQVLPLRMSFLQVRILQTTSRPITKHYHCQYFPPRSTTAAARYRSLPAQTSLLDRLMIANQPLSHSANPTAKSKQNKTKHSSSVPLDTSASHCRTLPPLPLYTAASFYPCRLLPPLIPLLPVFRSHRCQLLASPLATASFNS
jgi:hypothetical protein